VANVSRNTYDPTKNYASVRLQQGVPLVDADWNEMDDIRRNELYTGLGLAVPDGVLPGSNALLVSLAAGDLSVQAGTALVGGRPATAQVNVAYAQQPWTNATRAAQDGVAVIPPLTTPAANRTDLVYLDVWEREVNSKEDGNLVNPAIGVETCVRLKREVAVRVAEGATALPAAPAGHAFLPLALLNRQAGQALAANQIVDGRPFFYATRGDREASFVPAFQPLTSATLLGPQYDPWVLSLEYVFTGIWIPRYKFYAAKPVAKGVLGLLPLVLPDGANLTALQVRGYTQGFVEFILLRDAHPSGGDFEVVLAQSIQPAGGATQLTFDSSFTIPASGGLNLVDNSRYYYSLVAAAGGTTYQTRLHGISIRYNF
jgi:hypothetical protein